MKRLIQTASLAAICFIVLLSSAAFGLEEAEFHCWYSDKQLDARDQLDMPLVYALINGERVMYTQITKKEGKPNSWDDAIYLGICMPGR